MSAVHRHLRAVPAVVRSSAVLGAALLVGRVSPAAAEILPENGTFSGVCHRDRWGVGRFKFFLVSPKLHERLKQFEDKLISLEVKVARQMMNPGPAEILEIGTIVPLAPPPLELKLVRVRNDDLPERGVEFACYATNTGNDPIDLLLGGFVIELFSPRAVKDAHRPSFLFADFTNHQMSIQRGVIQWLNQHWVESNQFGTRGNIDYGHHVQLAAGESAPLVIRRQFMPGEYEARLHARSMMLGKPKWETETWQSFDYPGELRPRSNSGDEQPTSGLVATDVEYVPGGQETSYVSFTIRDRGQKPRKIMACLRAPEAVLAGLVSGIDAEGRAVGLDVKPCYPCSNLGEPWRLAAVGRKGISTTVGISKPGGGPIKPNRLKLEILTDRGLATFWLAL